MLGKGVVFAIAASIGIGVSQGAERHAASSPHGPAQPRGLRAHLQVEMQKRHIPGMQVAVVRHGKVVLLDSFGLANIEHAVPVTNETVFQINSVTKAFTGVAIMQLVEAGALDLAAPISRYLDGLPTAWQAVTPEQLATHTSGLPDILDSVTARMIVDGDAEASWAKVQTLPMEFSPGERFSYNQTNYLILGKIIDQLSGEPFTQYIQGHQLDVAGMPHTVYGDDRDVILNTATTYTFMRVCKSESSPTDLLCKPHVEFPEFLRTVAGLNSNAQELGRWIVTLQRGKLLKEKSSLTTLWTPGRLTDGEPSAWAIGWPVQQRARHRVYMPTGGGKVAMGVYPDDDLSVVILTNLSWDVPVELVEDVAGYYIADLHTDTSAHKIPAVLRTRCGVRPHCEAASLYAAEAIGVDRIRR